ncbi:MAG: DUF563 domain-containing protein [Pirellulales bacterium]
MNPHDTSPAPPPAAWKQAARRQLWFVWKWFQRGWRSILPPRATYSSLVSLDAVDEAWPVYRQIFAAPFVHNRRPEDEAVFQVHHVYAHREVTLPPISLNRIPRAQLCVLSGLILDARDRIVVESAKGLAMIPLYPEFGRLRRWSKVPYRDHPLVSTIMGYSAKANWFHWVVDSLPRLYALSQVDDEIALLVPPSLGGARRTILEWALPANVRLCTVDEKRPVACENILLSPFTTISGCGLLRPEIAQYLRAKVFAHVDRAAGPPYSKRIYTTRKFDPVRRVANEDELVAALEPLGFQVVYPGKMSLADQVRCFAGAEIVVGAHGANLTGLLFASGATAIEIAPLNLCYWGLCASVGNRHVAIPPEIDSSGEHAVLRRVVDAAQEFRVDVASVVRAVQAAIA